MPSAMAVMTRSRNRAITGFSVLPCSAAGEAALAAAARVVGHAVVLEDGLFVGCGQLAIGADRGGVPDQLLVVGDLQVGRPDGGPGDGNEDEPVTGRQSCLHRAERRQLR